MKYSSYSQCHHKMKFFFQSGRSIIHRYAWCSVFRVILAPSRYGLRNGMAQAPIRHYLGVVSQFLLAILNYLSRYSNVFFRLSNWLCISAHLTFWSHASVSSVKSPFVLCSANTVGIPASILGFPKRLAIQSWVLSSFVTLLCPSVCFTAWQH